MSSSPRANTATRWPNAAAYECFLATKHIDHVVISGEYNKSLAGKRDPMLDALVDGRQSGERIQQEAMGQSPISSSPPASARRDSLRDCNL